MNLTPTWRQLTDPLVLLQAQLEGMELWHVARRSAEESLARPQLSREARLDVARRLEVRRREFDALVGSIDAAMADRPRPLPAELQPRAVVAHRQPWLADKLAAELSDRGMDVVHVGDNGADVVGACVAEQPGLVVVHELLGMRTGGEVVHEIRQFCPHSLIAGYVSRGSAVAALLEAGATCVFTQRMPLGDVVDQLVARVTAD